MTTLLNMLDRFEQAAVTYETSTKKADREELHAARRAIMEAFEALEAGVKPLEWDEQTAKCIFGTYHVASLPNGKWYVNAPEAARPTRCEVERFGSEFSAQEAANADYTRVVRALSASPQPSPAIMEREAELVKALEPFIRHYESWMERLSDDDQMTVFPRHTVGELRAARAALRSSQQNT